MSENYEVTIILDRSFGDRLLPIAEHGPVWIIESPTNQAAAKICWERRPTRNHLSGVTVFKSIDAMSPEDALLAELSTIDLHHGEYSADPPYTAFNIVGAQLTKTVRAGFAEFDLDEFVDTVNGFRATRSSNESARILKQ